MKCPSCEASYDEKFAFCPYCGTAKPQLPAVRVLVEDDKYRRQREHRTERFHEFVAAIRAVLLEEVA
jgi:hypothetical protein